LTFRVFFSSFGDFLIAFWIFGLFFGVPFFGDFTGDFFALFTGDFFADFIGDFFGVPAFAGVFFGVPAIVEERVGDCLVSRA